MVAAPKELLLWVNIHTPREACRKKGLKMLVPTKSVRDRINNIIFKELVYGEIREESGKYLHTQIRILGDRRCDSVVLGCTELPLIISPEGSPLPVLDSTRILSRAALSYALKK